jgi:hypothetical protein
VRREAEKRERANLAAGLAIESVSVRDVIIERLQLVLNQVANDEWGSDKQSMRGSCIVCLQKLI